MPELVESCPSCRSTVSAPFDQRQFHGQPVTNVICRSCGLVYQSPRMTQAESQAFYEAEYRLLYQGQEGPNPKDLSVQAGRARAILEFTSSQVKECRRLLEIGCSTGILLKELKDHYHAEAVGIEPGNAYRQHARSLGLEVYASLDELAQNHPASFDLLCMVHVLEHLPEPVEYLDSLRQKYLSPGGWLLLEVPNLFAHDCFEVAHMVSFSAHTLKQVVEKAGFRVVWQRTHGQPRSRLIPLYLTLLAKPVGKSDHHPRREHCVRRKRQLGMLRNRVVTRLFPGMAWISPENIKQ